jgi:acyl-CoA reductase-like NAD-dependent aldehyde dehydrogenase
VLSRERLYIGGRWVAPAGDGSIDVRSPHDGTLVARVPEASASDADRAIDAARGAFLEGGWVGSSGADRAASIRALSLGLQARADELAATITDEMGSPAKFCLMGQVFAATMVLDGFADLAEQLAFSEDRPGLVGPCRVQKVPVGVCVGIVPWNVPLFLTCMKLGAAMAAGAPIVLKPPTEAPVDSFLLADVLDEVGVPAGAVSILPGGAELGRYLVTHPGVDKVSFTGSTTVGAQVGALCGERFTRCTLELGGKSAAVILDDADPAAVVPQVLDAGLVNNGQVCAAQTRILVPRSRAGEFVDALEAGVRAQVVGDPHDPATDVGPLVSARQRGRVEGLVEVGRAEGARVAVGGRRPEGLDDGWYVEPTLFVDADNSMRIAREEIFGPVLTVIAHDGDDDAVALANDSEYGLSGSVWTGEPERGVAVAERIRTGTCAVNSGVVVEPRSPFGGFRSSGVGRELGREGVEAYLETRTIVLPLA